MPFIEGNQLGHGRPKGSKNSNRKSIWLLQSLQEHGYDYEKMLTNFLAKAAKGDKMAYDMAALLVKMVPYLANMPKTDHAQVQIETLVINRLDSKPSNVLPDGHPPLDAEVINESSQSETK